MNDKKWIGAMISISVFDMVKSYSIDSGLRMQSIIEKALLEYVEKHKIKK